MKNAHILPGVEVMAYIAKKKSYERVEVVCRYGYRNRMVEHACGPGTGIYADVCDLLLADGTISRGHLTNSLDEIKERLGGPPT